MSWSLPVGGEVSKESGEAARGAGCRVRRGLWGWGPGGGWLGRDPLPVMCLLALLVPPLFVFAAREVSAAERVPVSEQERADFASSAGALSADELRLVWSDEFTVDGPPDPSKWSFEEGFVRNEELQWYQRDNAQCQDGKLVIEGRRERVANPGYVPGSNDWRQRRQEAAYTSACVLTRGKASWQYGRIEVRAKIDVRPGLWPAFWTLGERGRWPACGEVDVMEYYDGVLLANAAWSDRRGRAEWDAVRVPLTELGDAAWADGFHVWRMDWDADRIWLSVDGRLLNGIDVAQAVNGGRSGIRHPFRQPHYVLLNLAIGGMHGGNPSETDFPARYEIDYVRVYERPKP